MGLVLGITSIVLAILASYIAGWAGVVGITILSGLAIVLTVLKNRKAGGNEKKKIGGIVCGFIGLIIALVIQVGMMSVADTLKNRAFEAEEAGEGSFPVLTQCLDSMKSLGTLGVSIEAQKNGLKMSDFQEELERLNKYIESHPVK